MIDMISCRIILESDSTAVVNRVSFRSDDLPLGEQTVASVSDFHNGEGCASAAGLYRSSPLALYQNHFFNSLNQYVGSQMHV
jgi:hypothetical protein